jgi:hypothetical protein
MIIYADTDVCRWHLDQIGLPYTRYIDDLKDTADLKLAVFHIPMPYDQKKFSEPYEQKLLYALDACDSIAILCSELHPETVKSIRKFQSPKIKYFLCGIIDNVNANHWMDWIITTTCFYKNNPTVLSQLTPYQAKSKMFDILLGQTRPHRDIVYNYITNHNLIDRVILTYMNQEKFIIGKNNSGWIWEDDGLEITDLNIKWTVDHVKYHGTYMSLSQIVPIDIYNQTAYSVVTETNFHNDFNFYTEKIVKPILAERLFIVFAGQNYLKNLRSLGFKTFDIIIDESYDSIEDPDLRFKLACEQIKYLCDQSQETILEQIRPITEHNKRVILATDWYGDFAKRFQEFLLAHVVQS